METNQRPDFELANAIRDTVRKALALTYEWESGSHVLMLCVLAERDNDKLRTFKITGLSQAEISDDFGERYIGFCTVLQSQDRVYLSLDPYKEFVESDKDNMVFVGRDMVEIAENHG